MNNHVLAHPYFYLGDRQQRLFQSKLGESPRTRPTGRTHPLGIGQENHPDGGPTYSGRFTSGTSRVSRRDGGIDDREKKDSGDDLVMDNTDTLIEEVKWMYFEFGVELALNLGWFTYHPAQGYTPALGTQSRFKLEKFRDGAVLEAYLLQVNLKFRLK